MKTKNILLILLISFLTAFRLSAAPVKDPTTKGVIVSDGINTFRSLIEGQHRNYKVVCPPTVHKGSLDRLARTTMAYAGYQDLDKGLYVLTEFWSVDSIKKMEELIATRDGAVKPAPEIIVRRALLVDDESKAAQPAKQASKMTEANLPYMKPGWLQKQHEFQAEAQALAEAKQADETERLKKQVAAAVPQVLSPATQAKKDKIIADANALVAADKAKALAAEIAACEQHFAQFSKKTVSVSTVQPVTTLPATPVSAQN